MEPLTRSAPSAQATDARGIVDFIDAIDGMAGIEPHSLMLLRHGHVIAEGFWAPYTAGGIQQLYSLGKSFTATAAGFAWAEGLLDLDATVVSYFPELDAEITDPRSRSIKIRHIASMSAGHSSEQWDRALAADRFEPVRGSLLEPPDGTPGVTFAYSQSTSYALGAIVRRVAGQSFMEFLRPPAVRASGHRRSTLASASGGAGHRVRRSGHHHRGGGSAGPVVSARRNPGRVIHATVG